MNYKVDVLVVGAGSAGVTAALAAARNGASVLLVERSGFLGGISATLPWLGFHDREYRQVVKGIADEFATELIAAGGAAPPALDPKCGSVFSLNVHAFKILAARKLTEAGVKILFQALFVDAIVEGNRVTGAYVESKSGRLQIDAKVVIDTSGDGDLAARAGLTWEKGRTKDGLVQAPTLVFTIGGVNASQLIEACRDDRLVYREWFKSYPDIQKKFVSHLDSLSAYVFGGFADLVEEARNQSGLDIPQSRVVGVKTHVQDEFLVVMTRVLGLDPTDIENMSQSFSRLYKQIPAIIQLFRGWIPGFSNAYLREIAPIMGVRESRRIIGDYVLTAEDVISGRRFDDAVSMGGYHIDIHRPSGSWVESYNVRAYTIPYRSLMSKDADNLLMAGKCISATHEAIGSTRVIPICMGQGHAVGIAAAIASRGNGSVRDISVSALQERLRKEGAEIGETLGNPNEEAIEKYGQLPLVDKDGTTGEADPVTQRSWVSRSGQ
jgi:hypothetical protein